MRRLHSSHHESGSIEAEGCLQISRHGAAEMAIARAGIIRIIAAQCPLKVIAKGQLRMPIQF